MKKYSKSFWPFVMLLILGFILGFVPLFVLRSHAQSEEEIFLGNSSTSSTNPNIKIRITDRLAYVIEPGIDYPVTWIIKGLKKGQQITHTDIHWAYLDELNTPEAIENYKNWYKTKEFSQHQNEYTDKIYLFPYEVKLPAIILVIHAIAEDKDVTLGPFVIDIVPPFKEE